MSIPEISVQQLQTLRHSDTDFLILDVRNPDEYEICNLGGYLIPIHELALRLHELKPAQHIIVHCHAGTRSRRATEYLIKEGFTDVHNLLGGITAWANEIDTTMRKY